MNRTEFTTLLKQLQAKELEINLIKGWDYAAGDDNVGTNFYETADFLGINPLRVCLVYIGKHLSAIKNFAHSGTLRSADLEERIVDIRLYCALFLALTQDQGEPKCT